MTERNNRAFQYRQRAEELRAILPDMTDQFCRKTLEKIIVDYEHLAIVQDGLAKDDS